LESAGQENGIVASFLGEEAVLSGVEGELIAVDEVEKSLVDDGVNQFRQRRLHCDGAVVGRVGYGA
jgi:hypothetical protein